MALSSRNLEVQKQKEKKRTPFLLLCADCWLMYVCAIAIYLCAWNTQVMNVLWRAGCSRCWYKTENRYENPKHTPEPSGIVNGELWARNQKYML